MNKLTVLIVDDEEDLREVMSFLVSSTSKCEVLTAVNGQEAIEMLEKNLVDLVFCDYNMPVKNGGDVYQYILEHSYPCRYVLCSADDPTRFPIFNDRSVFFHHIEKPKLSQGVKSVFQKLEEEQSPMKIPPPEDYTPIGIRLLVQFHTLPASIYIKLSKDNYIKVYEQGDIFDETDYVKYQQKGFDRLYALNFGIDHILQNIQSKIVQLLASAKERCNVDTHVEIHGLIVSSLQSYGLRHELTPLMAEQMNAAIDHCTKDKLLTPLLAKLLRAKDTYLSKHSFILTMITLALADKAGWPSTATVQKLAFSSLFHDIFLKESTTNELSTLMGKKFEDDFLTHPAKAAELLDQMSSVPPDTGRIILEQHEIGEELGFPKKLPIWKISPLGQLFSFAHIFVDIFLEENAKGAVVEQVIWDRLAPFSELSSQYRKFNGYLKELNLFGED